MSMDDPETILQIVEEYPEFKEIYEQIYEICRNLEGVMGMYSKELQELDRNSVELMVNAMQKDLDKTREELDKTIKDRDRRLEEKDKEIETLRAELARLVPRREYSV